MGKEVNETRMVGVLPSQGADPIPVGKIPDNGSQITRDEVAVNSAPTVHQVPSGKTGHITFALLTIRNSDTAIKTPRFFITNDSDVEQYSIQNQGVLPDTQHMIPMTFNPPLEVPSEYKVKVSSDDAALSVALFIHGYEV